MPCDCNDRTSTHCLFLLLIIWYDMNSDFDNLNCLFNWNVFLDSLESLNQNYHFSRRKSAYSTYSGYSNFFYLRRLCLIVTAILRKAVRKLFVIFSNYTRKLTKFDKTFNKNFIYFTNHSQLILILEKIKFAQNLVKPHVTRQEQNITTRK